MAVNAGVILHVGANNIVDRIQSAGLGDVRIPTEVIREVGNTEVVDKVPGDADFTFTLESLDVSTEVEAFLTGKRGTGVGSGAGAGDTDPDGTEYQWADCQFVNITSPWKDPDTGSAGTIEAGHLIPSYYPTRARYRFGVTDNATEEFELAGGSFYYAGHAPVEDFLNGTGAQVAFATTRAAVAHRKGGVDGTTFRRVFGVLVDGKTQIEGVDYTESGPGGNATGVATVTFTTAPVSGADVRFVYFTDAAEAWPQTRHASVVTKPAAVRGRNICLFLAGAKLGSVQSFELEATVDGDVEREFCNTEIVGRTINGRDCNGQVVVRSKDADAFMDLLSTVTGVGREEVFGYLNQNPIELELQIQNPRDPGVVLKTLYVDDAIFQVPGTPARVNAPTDFTIRWESQSGTYSAFKGERA